MVTLRSRTEKLRFIDDGHPDPVEAPEAARVLLDAGLVGLLAERGADLEVADMHDRRPLLVAASWGHLVVLRVLLDRGAAVDARDPHGQTALWWGAEAAGRPPRWCSSWRRPGVGAAPADASGDATAAGPRRRSGWS